MYKQPKLFYSLTHEGLQAVINDFSRIFGVEELCKARSSSTNDASNNFSLSAIKNQHCYPGRSLSHHKLYKDSEPEKQIIETLITTWNPL